MLSEKQPYRRTALGLLRPTFVFTVRTRTLVAVEMTMEAKKQSQATWKSTKHTQNVQLLVMCECVRGKEKDRRCFDSVQDNQHCVCSDGSSALLRMAAGERHISNFLTLLQQTNGNHHHHHVSFLGEAGWKISDISLTASVSAGQCCPALDLHFLVKHTAGFLREGKCSASAEWNGLTCRRIWLWTEKPAKVQFSCEAIFMLAVFGWKIWIGVLVW